SFKLNKLTLNGLVCDSANHHIPLGNATVLLLTPAHALITKTVTEADGKFSFPLNFGQEYVIKTSQKGYIPMQQSLTTKDAGISIDLTIPLAKEAIPQVEFFCTIADKSSGEKLEGVHIMMTDSLTHMSVLDTLTSSDGSFRKAAPSIKLNDNLVYKIQISKKGYLAKSVLLLHKVTSYEINLNDFLQVTLDKIDLGVDIGKLLDLKPIYFDLGKANIRRDAAIELDKVVKAMNDNPGIRIELGSHTDSRGTAASNMVLSDKRAKSAAEYLYSKGIARDRIISKGYGDTMPLNQCVKGVKCTEEEYQVNRRTEFKILSVE
ncbi:MAG TPA: OmpA family protein, partial [Bacteroidales bacterium]